MITRSVKRKQEDLNAMLDIKPKRANVGKLERIQNTVMGSNLKLKHNMSMRQFDGIHRQVIHAYLSDER